MILASRTEIIRLLFFISINNRILNMKIYYIKLNDEDVKGLTRREIKQLQSKLGKRIVDFIGEKIFNIENRSLIINNNKPEFEYSDIQFNISHSNRIIIAAFDDYPLGIDVEYMKERDFKKLAKHYSINTSDKTEFYKKWTQLEAEIKIQSEIRQTFSTKFENDYMLTITSSNPETLTLEINQLKNFKELSSTF